MTQVIRTITSSARLIIHRQFYPNRWTTFNGLSVPIRTIFSSSAIGLDNFKVAREQHASRHAPSIGTNIRSFSSDCRNLIALDGFKRRFLQSIDQSDLQIFTDDLKNMILSANTDEEIDGVIQALRK